MALDRSPVGLPELAKLTEAYEIESELHRGRAAVTWLAQQKPEGRRVTLTVIDAATPAERNALTHLAADSRLLTTARHPHVVPVVETRWLAANRLAIVRARVRGATLRQTLDSVGPMPEPRVVEILRELADILDWGARTGLVHRNVDSEAVCFQKGSGKVMVSFGLPAILAETNAGLVDDAAFLLERCIDGATLARLGYELLTAHHAGDASLENLRAVRPELPPRVHEAIAAGLNCGADTAPLDARRFVTLLTGEEPAIGAAAIATAASAPVVPRDATAPVPPPQLPLGGPTVGNPAPRERSATPRGVEPPAPAGAAAHPARPIEERPREAGPHFVVPPHPAGSMPYDGPPAPPRRRSRGSMALVVSLVALLVLVGGTFILISHERSTTQRATAERTTATRGAAATERRGEAAGDVEVGRRVLPPDPNGLTVSTPGAPGAPGAPEIQGDPDRDGVASPVATPQGELPVPVRPTNRCASPEPADQRACFSDRLAARDADLNSVYQSLARELAAREGDGAVETLRYEQRAWLADRDRRCRETRTAAGATWAPALVDCLGRISDTRALVLARRLARVRSEPR